LTQDASWACTKPFGADSKKERELFEEAIPSIPQYMIPRWKRLLYEPRVGILNKV
jgi:hypothetical protein